MEEEKKEVQMDEIPATLDVITDKEVLKRTVLGYIENKEIAKLKKYLIEAEETAILELVEDLKAEKQAIVFRLLPKDEALYVFERLDVSDQEELVHALGEEQVRELFEELAPDDRVYLLDELPAGVAKSMLDCLSKEERAKTNLLMGYESETAGRIMTPDYISLRREMTAKQALSKVKTQAKDEDKETVYTLYVIDNDRRYEGRLTLRELLIADDNAIVGDIMDTGIEAVTTCTDQEEVVKELQRLGLLSIPVVDKQNLLVGIVTIDDALDILEEEATEDMLGKAKMKSSKKGDSSEALIKGSIWQVLKVRLPFLGFTIIGGILAALVMDGFEDILATLLAAVFFVPLIMDMGGTIGVQSSTIFIRGMTLGHVNEKKIGKHILREPLIGLTIGTIVGVASGLIAFIWQGATGDWMPSFWLGLSITVAMISVCVLAAVLGFVVPFIFHKLKFDQAAATGPVITTLKDVLGLLIYFGIVILFVQVIGGIEPYYGCECYACICCEHIVESARALLRI